FDDEVDSHAVDGPHLGWSDNGHQRSSGADQTSGSLPDVAADEIEHQIDGADVFESLVVEIDELVGAEVECRLTIGGASGADHIGPDLTCELRDHRADCSGRAVREHTLPGPKTTVHQQSLPRGQA